MLSVNTKFSGKCFYGHSQRSKGESKRVNNQAENAGGLLKPSAPMGEAEHSRATRVLLWRHEAGRDHPVKEVFSGLDADFKVKGHGRRGADLPASEFSASDVVVMDFAGVAPGEALSEDSIRRIAHKHPTIVWMEEYSHQHAVAALRLGVEDVLDARTADADFVANRISHAIERHTARSVESAETLSRAQFALDRVPMGVVLLDRDGKIRFLNQKAKAYLSGGFGLYIAPGNICAASNASEHVKLRRLIDEVSAGESEEEQERCALNLTGSDEGLSLSVLVSPVGTPGESGSALFLSSVEEDAPVSAPVLSRLYGLTTAEAGIVVGLVSGLTPNEIAEVKGTSANTVRTQLKQAFQKTGVKRQAELVKLVLTGPAAILQNK